MIGMTISGCLLIKDYEAKLRETYVRYFPFEPLGMQRQIHYIFGNPPVPLKPETPNSLSSTYYRGNDERFESMYNGGRYLTCTFKLALVDEANTVLNFGDTVEGKKLFVKFDIIRAPYTADILFSKRIMGGVFLTSTADIFDCRKSVDAVKLEVTKEDQEWTSLFPVAEGRKGVHKSIIYCWERRYYRKKEVLPKLQYAIQYHIATENGKLTKDSNIWLGAMRLPMALSRFKVTMDEWLDTKPKPPLPSANTTDIEKLGILEHVKNE